MAEDKDQAMPTRKTNADEDRPDLRAIDRLAESLNQFRVEIAKSQGGTDAKIEQLMTAVKALDGFATKISALETRCAVVENRLSEHDKRSRDWRDESVADRASLHRSDDNQNRWLFVGMGILATVEVVLTLLAPAIQAALHLP